MLKINHIILIFVLASLAIFVRFTAIEDREFFNGDEYSFYMGANQAPLVREFLSELPGVLFRRELLTKYFMSLIKAVFPGNFLFPVYVIASVFGGLLFGVRPEAAFYMSAIFGLLTLTVFYMLVKQLFSRRVAVFAVFLMAFSGTHVFYSRSALWVSLASFLSITSAYFFVLSIKSADHSRRNRAFCGFFLALAGSTHPLYFLLGAVYLLVELYGFFTVTDKRKWLIDNIFILWPFILVMAAWEIPYFLVHCYFAYNGRIPFMKDYYSTMILINNINTYSMSFMQCLSTNAGNYANEQMKSPYDSIYFLKYLNLSEGLGFTWIAFIGIFFVLYRFIKERRGELLLVSAWAIGLTLFFSHMRMTMQTRHYVAAMPAIFISIAYLLDYALRHANKKIATAFTVLFMLYFSCHSFFTIPRIIKSKMCLKAISSYIENNALDDIVVNSVINYMPGQEHATRSLPGFRSGMATTDGDHKNYGSVRSTRHFDDILLAHVWLDWDDMRNLYNKGLIRYMITGLNDTQKWPPPGALRNVKPLAAVPNPHFVYPPGVFDSMSFAEADKYLNNDSLQYVGLYDLKDVFGSNVRQR